MRKRIVLLLFLWQLIFLVSAAQPQNQNNLQNAAQDQQLLEKILLHSAEYCDRFQSLVFNFYCLEKIKETFYEYRKKTVIPAANSNAANVNAYTSLLLKNKNNHTLTYDYQVIRNNSKQIQERRILIEEDGAKKKQDDAPLLTVRAKYQFMIFGPVGFLSRDWQKEFHYEIITREGQGESEMVVIKATPTTARAENNNIARLWIRSNDFYLYKIEWEPMSFLPAAENDVVPAPGLKKKSIWTVWYNEDYHGIHFPSKQSIREVLINAANREFENYTAEISYGNYKFFQVDTNVIEEKVE